MDNTNKRNKDSKLNKTKLIICIIVILVIALGIGLGVALYKKDKDQIESDEIAENQGFENKEIIDVKCYGYDVPIENSDDINEIKNILENLNYDNDLCKGEANYVITIGDKKYEIINDCKEIRLDDKQASIDNVVLARLIHIIRLNMPGFKDIEIVPNEKYEEILNSGITKQENVIDIDSKTDSNNNDDTKNVSDSLNNMINNHDNGVNTLDSSVFLTYFDNYNPESNLNDISLSKALEIAQIGFDESAKRIASEGTSNIESQRYQVQDEFANNYFTAYYAQPSKQYTNIKRKCYVVSRENEMGCGISIYIDIKTGLIIGGQAYGD